MTQPPATCELCGGTGLYSPSALPCPKGCSAEDIVDRLNDIWSTDDHELGCQGRDYSCSCGFDDRTFATAKSAAEYISNMRAYIADLEKREKDARAKVLELAAVHAECAADDRPGRDRNFDWNDGYIDGCRGAAAAIRDLMDEVR